MTRRPRIAAALIAAGALGAMAGWPDVAAAGCCAVPHAAPAVVRAARCPTSSCATSAPRCQLKAERPPLLAVASPRVTPLRVNPVLISRPLHVTPVSRLRASMSVHAPPCELAIPLLSFPLRP